MTQDLLYFRQLEVEPLTEEEKRFLAQLFDKHAFCYDTNPGEDSREPPPVATK